MSTDPSHPSRGEAPGTADVGVPGDPDVPGGLSPRTRLTRRVVWGMLVAWLCLVLLVVTLARGG